MRLQTFGAAAFGLATFGLSALSGAGAAMMPVFLYVDVVGDSLPSAIELSFTALVSAPGTLP